MKKFWIPTGCLFVDQYEKGELETLSSVTKGVINAAI